MSADRKRAWSYLVQCALCLATVAFIYPDSYAFVWIAFSLVDAFMAGANWAGES